MNQSHQSIFVSPQVQRLDRLAPAGGLSIFQPDVPDVCRKSLAMREYVKSHRGEVLITQPIGASDLPQCDGAHTTA